MTRQMGGCERCCDPNRESGEYKITAKNNAERRFCDDCARNVNAIYALSPTPKSDGDSAPVVEEKAPAAKKNDK